MRKVKKLPDGKLFMKPKGGETFVDLGIYKDATMIVDGLPWPCESGDHEHCPEINREACITTDSLQQCCQCECHTRKKPS
ncbi:MAG: hypothetical protein JWO48_1209 [Bryobacterales bacterium]|nr:hypothetical protein [Bryobacterales bacterium]